MKYTIVLDDSGGSSPSAPIRLRRLLKLAGRYLAFRCVDIRADDSMVGDGGQDAAESVLSPGKGIVEDASHPKAEGSTERKS